MIQALPFVASNHCFIAEHTSGFTVLGVVEGVGGGGGRSELADSVGVAIVRESGILLESSEEVGGVVGEVASVAVGVGSDDVGSAGCCCEDMSSVASGGGGRPCCIFAVSVGVSSYNLFSQICLISFKKRGLGLR
jgi:hypothetical protein